MPPLPNISGDVSDSEDDITAELDDAIPKHSLLHSQAARHRAELAHKGTLASRQRPSLDGLKTQLSGSSLPETDPCEVQVTTVTRPTPDTPVTVKLAPVSPVSTQSPVSDDMTPVSNTPSKNPLMEELLAVQKRRGSGQEMSPVSPSHVVVSDSGVSSVTVSGHHTSFQDQLKSKLEARKRSLEGGDDQIPSPERHAPHDKFKLPLSEAQQSSYKGKYYIGHIIDGV